MAQTKFISFVLLTLIIMSQGFCSSEARYLKAQDDHDQKGTQNLVKHEEFVQHGTGGITTNEATLSPPSPTLPTEATGVPPPPGRDVEDFRPTAPGHSPGVGHSTHN